MEFKTKSICVPLWSVVSTHANASEFHVLWIVASLPSPRQFSPHPPSLPPCTVFQCDGLCLSPLPAWELIAGLLDFASCGSSLHLGAGWQ